MAAQQQRPRALRQRVQRQTPRECCVLQGTACFGRTPHVLLAVALPCFLRPAMLSHQSDARRRGESLESAAPVTLGLRRVLSLKPSDVVLEGADGAQRQLLISA